MLSKEMSNSSTFEDEAVNNDVSENSNADSAAEEVTLQLTVEDDPAPVFNSSSAISPVTEASVITNSSVCLTGCSRNMPSALVEKHSSGRTLSRQASSDVTAAQAKVFRQYLLDGDIQARILELDGRRVCVQFM